MSEIEMLKNRISTLENILANVVFSDRYLFQKNVEMFNGRNIILNIDTGTQIGTEPEQKLGLYGVAPVAQYSTTGTTSDMTTVGGVAVTESNGFGGGLGGNYYTIGDIVRALKLLGILE